MTQGHVVKVEKAIKSLILEGNSFFMALWSYHSCHTPENLTLLRWLGRHPAGYLTYRQTVVSALILGPVHH